MAGEETHWKTIPQLVDAVVERQGERPALMTKVGAEWQPTTYAGLATRYQRVARALVERGIEAGDRICLLARNRVEWPIVDLGILRVGAANVPIYPTSTPEQILYILDDCRARMIFVEDPEQLEKVERIRDRAEALEQVVVIAPGEAELAEGDLSLEAVEQQGDGAVRHDEEIERRLEALDAEDLASIVYTSGTTGSPKGVMLPHRCFAHQVRAGRRLVAMDAEDVTLSFLPLSHTLERTVGYYLPITAGATICYAESQEQIGANLAEVRPTLMISVPRLYEKMQARIVEKVEAAGGLRRALFYWAVDSGRRRAQAVQGKTALGLWDRLRLWLADRLVFSKILAVTGGRLRFFVSGGAPLSPELGEFFLGAGVHILEGYGLTETAPMVAANTPACTRLGTVGRPLEGVEVRIAGDGEILVRGPNVMRGYFGDDEATREALDEDGWFHTGDVGEFDDEGCLRITDRKKNLLVLANGKNVAPAPIENVLVNSPLIAQAVVLGDNQRFVSALIAPAHDRLRDEARERLEDVPEDVEELCAEPRVVELVLEEVQRRTAGFAGFEQPKKIVLLPRELSEAEGELTPTLKVKRKVVLERYGDRIQEMYAAPAPSA